VFFNWLLNKIADGFVQFQQDCVAQHLQPTVSSSDISVTLALTYDVNTAGINTKATITRMFGADHEESYNEVIDSYFTY